jgi:hypothetical protein
MMTATLRSLVTQRVYATIRLSKKVSFYAASPGLCLMTAGHGIQTMFDGNPTDLDSLADYLMEIIFGAGFVALLILFLALLRLHTGRRVQSYGIAN